MSQNNTQNSGGNQGAKNPNWPSTKTGESSGGGRGNNPPSKPSK